MPGLTEVGKHFHQLVAADLVAMTVCWSGLGWADLLNIQNAQISFDWVLCVSELSCTEYHKMSSGTSAVHAYGLYAHLDSSCFGRFHHKTYSELVGLHCARIPCVALDPLMIGRNDDRCCTDNLEHHNGRF